MSNVLQSPSVAAALRQVYIVLVYDKRIPTHVCLKASRLTISPQTLLYHPLLTDYSSQPRTCHLNHLCTRKAVEIVCE